MDWKSRLRNQVTTFRKKPRTREALDAMRKTLKDTGVVPRTQFGELKDFDSMSDNEIERLYRMALR